MKIATEQNPIIVGCVVAGLSAANRAVEKGLDITVLEKSPNTEGAR